MVDLYNCDLNVEFKTLPQTDKELLWNSTNICTKCESSADCPGGSDGGYYCDQGTCKSYDAPCPPSSNFPINDQATCNDDPCLTAKPCTDAKCVVNKCDKCGWPLWIDPNGNRVCQGRN
jgi:hypothetical protein